MDEEYDEEQELLHAQKKEIIPELKPTPIPQYLKIRAMKERGEDPASLRLDNLPLLKYVKVMNKKSKLAKASDSSSGALKFEDLPSDFFERVPKPQPTTTSKTGTCNNGHAKLIFCPHGKNALSKYISL
jgi:hypothetical protein